MQGYRLFECANEDCGHKWKDRSRDCYSESSDMCPKCHTHGNRIDSEPHPEWPIDLWGNLL